MIYPAETLVINGGSILTILVIVLIVLLILYVANRLH